MTILQVFPYPSGAECWVRWHLGRGEPHLAEIVVRGVREEELYWEWDGWPWPATRLVEGMDDLPAAGPVSLTPRGRLTQGQFSSPGGTDEDRRRLSEDGVKVVGGEEEEWEALYFKLRRELWQYPDTVRRDIVCH